VNQVWNWVKGEGSSWERSREPFVYWSACLLEGSEVGATVGGGGLVRGEGKRRGGGQMSLHMSLEDWAEAIRFIWRSRRGDRRMRVKGHRQLV